MLNHPIRRERASNVASMSEVSSGSVGIATSFDRLIGIIALPRSGTTVATAVLDVHSDVMGFYEPWNDARERVDAREPVTLGDFMARYVPGPHAERTLLVKETTTNPAYIDRVADLLRTAEGVERRLVVILRNPLHVFLSEMQARQRWWGSPDLRIGADTFAAWAQRTIDGLRQLARTAREFDGLFLSYEKLTADPEMGVVALTRALGLRPQPAQLAFERHFDRSKVRGDNNVVHAPKPLSTDSVAQRGRELDEVLPLIRGAEGFERIRELGALFAGLPLLTSAAERPDVVAELTGAVNWPA